MKRRKATVISAILLALVMGLSSVAMAASGIITGTGGVTAEYLGGTTYLIKVTAPGATEVQFPTWSAASGQNDLVWYNATNVGGDVWEAQIDTAPHGGGLMYTTAYANGAEIGSVSYDAPVTTIPAALAQHVDGYIWRITVTNCSGANRVQLPTWSAEDGQWDIQWYNATKQLNGTWTCDINIATHGGGVMITDVYADGKPVTTVVYDTPLVGPYATVKFLGGTKYEVIVYNCGNAQRVLVPTWGVWNGQDDLAWYWAQNQGHGVWTAVIDSARHDMGLIVSHVYVDGVLSTSTAIRRDFPVAHDIRYKGAAISDFIGQEVTSVQAIFGHGWTERLDDNVAIESTWWFDQNPVTGLYNFGVTVNNNTGRITMVNLYDAGDTKLLDIPLSESPAVIRSMFGQPYGEGYYSLNGGNYYGMNYNLNGTNVNFTANNAFTPVWSIFMGTR